MGTAILGSHAMTHLATAESHKTSKSQKSPRNDRPGFTPGKIGEFSRSARSGLVNDLFDAHYDRVYCFLRRMVSAERAEDLAQEVFFRLLKHSQLERVSVTTSYLLKIAENLVKNGYRRDMRRREITEDLRTTKIKETSPTPVADELEILDSKRLAWAMEVLTANERSAITLIVCRGLSYQSASLALGVSITTINNWKHRGIAKLKERLSSKSSSKQSSVIRSEDESRPAVADRPGRIDGKQAAGSSAADRVDERAGSPIQRFGRAG
jgi:RNA polymerase sigma-70 factor (ECF subfamily)